MNKYKDLKNNNSMDIKKYNSKGQEKKSKQDIVHNNMTTNIRKSVQRI